MKNSSLMIIITFLFVCVVALLATWAIGKDSASRPAASSLSSEGSSSATPVSSPEKTSGISEESGLFPGESEPESSPESEPSSYGDQSQSQSQDYEEMVGKKYAIDISPYLEYIAPKDFPQYQIYVSKNTPSLASDYVPADMVVSPNARPGREDNCLMVKTAAKALEALLKEAAFYGYDDITVTNAYRSYALQSYLFNDYYFKIEASNHPGLTSEEIRKIVSSYSFPPGHSEHQTGLCVDMHNLPVGNQESFNNTPAAKWLEENSYRFGFILRYPEGGEVKTGAVYESWHYRFVGRALATLLYEKSLTLDEFYGYVGS
ncbi:MAG: M15 family metallopeptidase [Eubacteriales bacterium]